MVNEEYKRKGARPGPHQVIEFESDMITLDIPMEGITTDGWKITPLMRPVVSWQTKQDCPTYILSHLLNLR